MSVILRLWDGAGSTAPAPAEFFTFPGGEQHLRTVGEFPADTRLVVDVRGADASDLVRAGIAASFARTAGAQTILLLPYLPAARSDHDEVMGAQVYADLVNGFHFDHVVAIDPHSPYSQSAYRRLTVADHTPLVERAVTQWNATTDLPVTGIIAADKSGGQHAAAIAAALDVPMFQALKHRDQTTGRLSGFSVEALPSDGRLLVVDDICDGGGTFLGLADVAGVPRDRLGLWVTHGVFSGAALTHLPERFGFIACTDSFRTIDDPVINQILVADHLLHSLTKEH